MTTKFIAELEDGVWLASGWGDPPRTLVKENARHFESRKNAAMNLARAIGIYGRPFESAKIEEIEVSEVKKST